MYNIYDSNIIIVLLFACFLSIPLPELSFHIGE